MLYDLSGYIILRQLCEERLQHVRAAGSQSIDSLILNSASTYLLAQSLTGTLKVWNVITY